MMAVGGKGRGSNTTVDGSASARASSRAVMVDDAQRSIEVQN